MDKKRVKWINGKFYVTINGNPVKGSGKFIDSEGNIYYYKNGMVHTTRGPAVNDRDGVRM